MTFRVSVIIGIIIIISSSSSSSSSSSNSSIMFMPIMCVVVLVLFVVLFNKSVFRGQRDRCCYLLSNCMCVCVMLCLVFVFRVWSCLSSLFASGSAIIHVEYCVLLRCFFVYIVSLIYIYICIVHCFRCYTCVVLCVISMSVFYVYVPFSMRAHRRSYACATPSPPTKSFRIKSP